MLKALANRLAAEGRHGDSTLVHMHPLEVRGLASLVPGGLTRNPTTGLPEAFNLWPLLGGLMLGGLGGMFLPGMLGLGAAGAAGGGAAASAAGVGGAAGAASGGVPAAAGIGSMLSSPLVMGAGLGGLAFADQMMAPTPPKLKKQKSGFHDYSYEASPDENGNFSGGYTYSGDDPNMQVYQPMYMAAGGPIGGYPVPYGMSPTSQGSDKRFDKQIVHAAIVALTSGSNPEAIQHFVARFGQAALSDLAQRVRRLGPPQGMGLAQSGPENESPVGQLVPSGMRRGGPVEGTGDGQSDGVSAMAGGQPVQLSRGEYVVPADVVSGLGNGSTQSGIGHLYRMVSKVREAKSGSPHMPPQIHAQNLMPA